MNKNALKKSSTQKVVTVTGKLPDSFGMPSGKKVTGGGIIRKLTKRELKQQNDLQKLNVRL